MNIKTNFLIVSLLGVLSSAAWGAPTSGFVRCASRGIIADGDGNVGPVSCQLLAYRDPQKGQGSVGVFSNDCPASITVTPSLGGATISGNGGEDFNKCSIVLKAADSNGAFSTQTPAETILINNLSNALIMIAPDAVSGYEGAPITFTAALMKMKPGGREAISGGTWTCSAVNPYGENVSCASIGASVTTSGAFSWTPGPNMERSWQFTIGAQFPRSKPYSKTITVQVRDLDPPAYVYLTLPKPGPAPAVNRRAKWNVTGKCAYPGDPVKISGIVSGTAECRADKTFGAVFNISSYDFSGTSHPLIVSHGHQTFTAIAHYKNIFANTTYHVEPTQSPATVAVEGGGTAYAGSYLNCSVDPAANPSINHIYYVLEWTGAKSAQVNIDNANAVKSRYQVAAADLGGSLGCRYQAFKMFDPEFLKMRSLASATVAPEEFTVEQLPEEIQPEIQADVASAKSTVNSNPNLTSTQKTSLSQLIDQKTKEAIQIGNPNGGKPQAAKELVAITANAVQACSNCNSEQVEKAASIAPSLAKQITPSESQATTNNKINTITQISNNYTEIVSVANSAPQAEQQAQQAVVQSVNSMIAEAASVPPPSPSSSPSSNPNILGAVAASIQVIAEVQDNPPPSTPPQGFSEIPQGEPTAEEQADPCHHEDKCHGSGWRRWCEPPPVDKLACKLSKAVESAGEEIERVGQNAGEAAVNAREAAVEVVDVMLQQASWCTNPSTPQDLRTAVVNSLADTADAIRSVGSSENKIAIAEAARSVGNTIAPVFTASDTWMRENAPFIIAKPYRVISDAMYRLKDNGPVVLERGAEFVSKLAEVTGDKITACLADESHCDPRPTVMIEKLLDAAETIGEAVYTNLIILDHNLVAFDEERVAFMNMVSQALDAAVADEDEARIWQGIEKFAATSGGKMAISWRKAYTTIKEDYPEFKDELVDTWHHILDMTPQLRDQAVAGIIWYSENIPNTWWYSQIASLGDAEHKDMYDKMWTHWSDVAAVIDAKTLPQREAMGQWLEQQGRVTLVNLINGYNYIKDKGPSWAEAAGDFLAQYDPGPGLAHIGRVLGRAAEMGAECTVNYLRQGECETLDAIAKGALHAKDVIDNYVTTEKLLKATDAAIDMASEFGEQVCDPACQKRNLKATQDFMQAVSDRASEGWNDALDAAYNYYQYVKAGGLANEWSDFSEMAAIIYESALPPETQKQIFQNLKGWMESVPGKAKASGDKFVSVAKKYIAECLDDTNSCSGGDSETLEKLRAAGRKAAELYHQAQQNPVLMAAADAIKDGWQILADGATQQGEFVVAYLDCIIRPYNKAERCLDGLQKGMIAADPADRLSIMRSVDSSVATYGSASAGDIAAVDEMIVASSSASDFAAVETIAEARENAPSVAVSAKVSDLMTATTAGTTTPTQIQAAAAGASVAVSAPSLSEAQRNAVLDDAVAVMNWSKSNASIAAPALAALSSSTTPANVASAKAMTLTSCTYEGQTILNTLTASRTRYQSAEVPEGNSCVSETQTAVCNEGTIGSFSGTYANSSCVVVIGCQGGLPKVAKYKDDDGDGFTVATGEVACPEAPGLNKQTIPADSNDAVAVTTWNAVKRTISRVSEATPRSDNGTTLYYNGDYNSGGVEGLSTWLFSDVNLLGGVEQLKHMINNCTLYTSAACGQKYLLVNDITFTASNCAVGGFGTWDATLNTCFVSGYGKSLLDGIFTGIFNGDGHTIRNLSIDMNGQGNAKGGLFGQARGGAIINNLTLEGGYVISDYRMGGVIGEVSGSTRIHKVINKNRVLVNMGCADCDAFAGGIVGRVVTGLRMYESANFGTVSKKAPSVTANRVGGLIGAISADTQVNRSFNAGQVDGNKYTGGLVGDAPVGFFYDVYNSGSVTATGIKWNGTLDTTNLARVGGLVGSGAFQMGRGFNYGSVVSPSTGRGIFLGYDAGIGVGDVYGLAYPGVTNAATFMTAQPTGSGSGMTAAQLRNTANFSIAPAQSWGFNLTTTWNIDANSFMYFRWFNYGACGSATAKPGCQ